MNCHFDLSSIEKRLQSIYGQRCTACAEQISQLLALYAPVMTTDRVKPVDQAATVLITYADQVTAKGKPALEALDQFLKTTGLANVLSHIHLLPFFPYSSDDGFSVIDYRKIDPVHGSWKEMQRLASRYGMMVDLVLNHVSAESDWFRAYRNGKAPFDRFFIEVDPATDLSQVTRPRALPLLTRFETLQGERHLWTTFSADQVDLNFADPDVLVEMIDVLLFFVAQGADIVRLDAIAYLWKEIGTPCIHRPQTHEIVKLLRDVLARVAPHVLLITETNVPHDENVSYFGEGDEAHLVYQFSLPPLLLEAMLSEDATALHGWLADLESPPAGCMYFNFTASHDGIGVRPLEGLVSHERFDRLVTAIRERGGIVGMKRDPSGHESPYELNISYFSALADLGERDEQLQVRRFLTTQAVMLGLQGVPGIYFHNLVGTPNDVEAAESSGIPRRINRRKFEIGELTQSLADRNGLSSRVLEGMISMLECRGRHAAFHPHAAQEVIDTIDPRLLLFRRTSRETDQEVWVAANFSSAPLELKRDSVGSHDPLVDLLASAEFPAAAPVQLDPFQCVWLVRAS